MLLELRIKNFAIIDELNLSFSKGFNILTGETGAGKSIILNAVQLLLGERASEELIRGSEEEASVEALFDISENEEVKKRIEQRDQRASGGNEDALLVRRVISRAGRGKAFINGNLATLGMLSEIGEDLLSIYGQHEHQFLRRVDSHIDILDEFGELVNLRKEFEELFQKFTSLSQELERIRGEKERREKERELMAFQSKEIERAGIRIGEEEALKEEKRILAHAKKLVDFANASEEALYSMDGSATERIHAILHQGKEMAAIDSSLSPILNNLNGVLIQLQEAALALRDYSKRIEVNPGRLEEIENRLEELDRLKRKYGPTESDILRFKEKVDESLRTFTSEQERLSRLEWEIGPLREEVTQRAQKLSRERKQVASELKRSVEKELATLGMKKTTFEVRVDDQALWSKGRDRIEFLISPNIGEEVKPLAKIASGGELSRIMLAIKRILTGIGGRQVLVFDEVDAGIGGAIAEVVGRKLRELSKHHQVICVTHLPQIASFADRHHSVRKEVRSGRTVTLVHPLEKEARVDEIARMLGGVKVTEKTRAHAQEMMENARKS
ncbi:MAG: DNA repair protein RecN [Thermodesulfobacteriota bacterium]